MAEDSDYNPGAWKGHDFASARAYYDTNAGRAYTDARTSGTVASDLVPKSVHTESTSPLVIQVDVTGSMGTWPATIFSKLPYLELEGKEYLGADMEISFSANGDTYADRYPLQVRPFNKGVDLKNELAKLLVEGGGGGGGTESYEVGALYYARNAEMPNAVKPIFIFIADEMPYPSVDPSRAETHAKVRIEKTLSTEEIFRELQMRFAVYLIHKPYSDGGATRREWVRLLGEDHIADLQDPNRVVDVIFGILAKETGRIDYFKKEIEDRQEVGTGAGAIKVDTVYKALKTIHKLPAPGAGKSTLHKPAGGKPTKGLL